MESECKITAKICRGQGGNSPVFCSTTLYASALDKAAAEYRESYIREFARQASIQEAECYIDRETEPHYR